MRAAGSKVTWGLGALAAAVALGTFLKAILDVSTTWDVWYYHLPFAARIWGIVPDDVYALSAQNQHRYDGFPLLAELLQGLLWVVLRRPEAANLLAFGSLAAYVVFLKRAFRVPLRMAVLALMAVPLVQMHASACYIDLPANVAASILVMEAYRLHARGGPASLRATIGICAAAAVAANMRFQLTPLVLVVLVFVVAREVRSVDRRRAARILAVACVALPIVFAAPIKNVVRHHNPIYPMKMELAGQTLPYAEDAYSDAPPYLENAPQAQRWVYSLLEARIRPMTDTSRWTLDQWMPPSTGGNRMGGAFGAYVILNLGVLGWLAYKDRSRQARVAMAMFALLTAMTAVMPQSHELRYYLYWMMVLVSLNLVLVGRRPAGEARAFGIACASALLLVLAVTRAWYVYPSRYSFTTLVQNKVNPSLVGQIRDGEHVCFYAQPWTFLYASTFHANRTYVVREGESASECGSDRFIE